MVLITSNGEGRLPMAIPNLKSASLLYGVVSGADESPIAEDSDDSFRFPPQEAKSKAAKTAGASRLRNLFICGKVSGKYKGINFERAKIKSEGVEQMETYNET